MKKRILVFEDSDMFAEIILEFLENQGYEAERAVNGLEGIKKVYTYLPDLIITDVEMPLFKGYQASRLLKSRKATKDIPLIMFTSLGETRDKFWGGNAGADCYVEKSGENFTELKADIELLLKSSREIDHELIRKEAPKITDDYLIELVNDLLDRKLFQATITSLLSELSASIGSLVESSEGLFNLLQYACEADIAALLIKEEDGGLSVFTSNKAGYAKDVVDDFGGLCMTDFKTAFPEFKIAETERVDFLPPGKIAKRLESYTYFTLIGAGLDFATLHIANSVKDYFSPYIHETLSVFMASAAPILYNAVLLRDMANLQRKTRAAFARYVPVDVMDEIIRKDDAKGLVSESRNVVVLFSDIRKFTTISENNDPQAVVDFLNRYFMSMGDEIKAQGGNVDKFIGDAIMAIFGAPKSYPDSPRRAIAAALHMVAALPKVSVHGIRLPPSGFAAGIGLNYGQCIVGNIGFQDKQDYTVIGDTVNLASRLEGVSKLYRHPIIVSDSLYRQTKDDFIFRKLDTVRVKGKDTPTEIYAVYSGYREPGSAGKPKEDRMLIDKDLLDVFSKALHLFRLREWDSADQYFSEALKIDPGDFLSAFYRKRIDHFKKNPPPDTWDGSVILTEK